MEKKLEETISFSEKFLTDFAPLKDGKIFSKNIFEHALHSGWRSIQATYPILSEVRMRAGKEFEK